MSRGTRPWRRKVGCELVLLAIAAALLSCLAALLETCAVPER